MDAGVLVLVLDLVAALFDRLVDLVRPDLALALGQRVADRAHLDGEVARRLRAGVEVLVEHLVGRGDNHAVVPVDADEVVLVLIPQQRIAVAGQGDDVGPVEMPVRLLVGAGQDLRGVAAERAVGQDPADGRRAAAASLPRLELEVEDVGDEVGLPLVAAGGQHVELAVAGEIALLAMTLGEHRRVLEDELLVAVEVHDVLQVVRRDHPRRLDARAVEVLIARIERDREQRVRAPFEAVGAPVRGLDRGRAGSLEDVDDLLVDVVHRPRVCARRQLEREHRDVVVAALQAAHRAVHAVEVPRLDVDVHHVDAEILDDGHRLALAPLHEGVAQIVRRRVGHHSILVLDGSFLIVKARLERVKHVSDS